MQEQQKQHLNTLASEYETESSPIKDFIIPAATVTKTASGTSSTAAQDKWSNAKSISTIAANADNSGGMQAKTSGANNVRK